MENSGLTISPCEGLNPAILLPTPEGSLSFNSCLETLDHWTKPREELSEDPLTNPEEIWIEDVWDQFSSVTQSCLTLCDPMDYSMPGLPVHHQLPELTQIQSLSSRRALLPHRLSLHSPVETFSEAQGHLCACVLSCFSSV